ncbi:MAG: hypothetical protein WBV82_11380 [Myxococcaceae bacterium]
MRTAVGSWQLAVGSRLLPALMLLLIFSGCGPEDRVVEGSLSEVIDLRYGKVDIVKNENDLSIRFLQPRGEGEDVVLRVSVDLTETSIDANQTFDLASLTPGGSQRGTISRSVLDDPLTSFPQLQRGELTFRRDVTSGETVPGEFRVTFVNGTELASGRTAFATFEATVQ